MSDSNYLPGSRAIKIPLSRMKHTDYTTPSRHRSVRDDRMQRIDSTEGSDAGSSMASTSSSRTREATLLDTQKTMASPANLRSTASTFSTPEQSMQRKDKQRARDSDVPPPDSVPARALNNTFTYTSPLSPSMLSSSSYKSINLNSHMSRDPDEPARIITYTKHSQGFTWNDELFLPSYLIGRRYGGRGGVRARRRWGGGYEDEDDDMDGVGDFDEEADRCPVTDIFVTDEEAARLLP